MTIIMVSHNFQDVVYLANRGAIIHQGKILQQGDTLFIFEKPNSRFTADFVGMRNILPIGMREGKMEVADTGLDILPARLPESGHTHMGIRPEDIVLNSNGPGSVPGPISSLWANRFHGQVIEISNHGLFPDVRLAVGDTKFEAIWPRSYLRDWGLAPGQAVDLAFHRESVHTF